MDGEDPADATEWVRWLRRRCGEDRPDRGARLARAVEQAADACGRQWPASISTVTGRSVQPMSASKRATSDEYPGERPFSEVESRVVRNLARSFAPHGYANVHSGEWAVYVPGITRRSLRSPFRRTLRAPRQTQPTLRVRRRTAGQVSGYLAYGTSMDYLYQELKPRIRSRLSYGERTGREATAYAAGRECCEGTWRRPGRDPRSSTGRFR